MPASGKMLKSRQQAANRAAGIGDEQGRLPARVKPVEVSIKCTQCSQEIRATKTNTEAKAHYLSRHPTFTFAEIFPGAFDPTVEAKPDEASASAAAPTPLKTDNEALKKKPVKKEDLSFLDAALATGSKKK